MGVISTIFLLIFIFFVLPIIFAILIYNKLVKLRNNFKNGFAQIEVQLKRRYDLIPNLVETAKGYLKHERETLERVISARNAAAGALKNATEKLSADDMKKFISAEQGLMGALGQLNVVMENYPDLKASQNMQQLSEELTSTENKVARSRQFFNDAATEYNNYRQSFPAILLAASFGHREDATLLEFEDSEQIQQAPDVSF